MTHQVEYIPSPAPYNIPPELRQYLDQELTRAAEAINHRVLFVEPLAAAPAKPEDGLIAYANGADWNPGSGEGFYGYENGSWVKL